MSGNRAEIPDRRIAPPTAHEITRILDDVAGGDHDARSRLLELVYDELHGLAGRLMRGEQPGHTLQPTALVNEAYLRLLGQPGAKLENRSHFFGAAAEVMRRILIDHARERLAKKRGGGWVKLSLDSGVAAFSDANEELLEVNEALAGLEEIHPRKARIVKLHFFAGLSFDEIAAVIDASLATVKREWRYARAWISRRIGHE